MNNSAVNVISYLIFVILALATLRDVISKFFSIPMDTKWSWIFYSKHEKEFISNFLCEIGLKQHEFRSAVKKQQASSLTNGKPEIKLVELISKYLMKTEHTVTFGQGHRYHSSFYINTMGASHNDEDLITMSNLLIELINKKQSNIMPDFIITPKAGNSILAHHLAARNRLCCILTKNSTDHSYALFPKEDSELHFTLNFEGASRLIDEAKLCPNRVFSGAIIDCNATSGSQLVHVMNSFNRDLLELQGNKPEYKNISPVTNAYVLFRPTCESIDNAFDDDNATCDRFFDLNDEHKSLIFEFCNNNKINHLDSINEKDRNFIVDFLKKTENI